MIFFFFLTAHAPPKHEIFGGFLTAGMREYGNRESTMQLADVSRKPQTNINIEDRRSRFASQIKKKTGIAASHEPGAWHHGPPIHKAHAHAALRNVHCGAVCCLFVCLFFSFNVNATFDIRYSIHNIP